MCPTASALDANSRSACVSTVVPAGSERADAYRMLWPPASVSTDAPGAIGESGYDQKHDSGEPSWATQSARAAVNASAAEAEGTIPSSYTVSPSASYSALDGCEMP